MRNIVVDGILSLPLPFPVPLLYLSQLQPVATTIGSGGSSYDCFSSAGTIGIDADTVARNRWTTTIRRIMSVKEGKPSQASLLGCSMLKLRTQLPQWTGIRSRYFNSHSLFLSLISCSRYKKLIFGSYKNKFPFSFFFFFFLFFFLFWLCWAPLNFYTCHPNRSTVQPQFFQ